MRPSDHAFPSPPTSATSPPTSAGSSRNWPASGPTGGSRSPASACRCSTSSRPRTPSTWSSTCPACRPPTSASSSRAASSSSPARRTGPSPRPGPASYHLVERDFGRFARAVRVHVAVDAARASATLRDGELRIVLPKIAERRGRGIPVRRSPTEPACVKLLFIGDIVGRPGRDLVEGRRAGRWSPATASTSSIANGENAAAGFGITREIGEQLFALGVDVMTSGNHIWDKKEVLDYIPLEPRLLRPANYPAGAPGAGAVAGHRRQRRAGRRGQRDGPRLPGQHRRPVHDGGARGGAAARPRARRSSSSTSTPRSPPRRSPWAGTSTARPPPWSARTRTCRPPTRACCRGGTAYLTDVGMTGPHDGVIGVEKARGHRQVPHRAADALRDRHAATRGCTRVLVAADAATGRATAIERLSRHRRRAGRAAGRERCGPTRS